MECEGYYCEVLWIFQVEVFTSVILNILAPMSMEVTKLIGVTTAAWIWTTVG